MHTNQDNHRGYEVSDANARSLALSGIGLFAIILAALALMYGALVFFERRHEKTAEPPHVLAEARQIPPAPRLQITPERDLQAFLAAEDSVLHGYGWVAREAGIVRIPIDSAMALLLRRGLPVRPATAGLAAPAGPRAAQEERP